MNVKILRSASKDLQDGFRFYERQSKGVGRYFIDSLFQEIDALQSIGGIHPVFRAPYHRMLSKRFPYAIYYRMQDSLVVIYAVIHVRRNPKSIDERLP